MAWDNDLRAESWILYGCAILVWLFRVYNHPTPQPLQAPHTNQIRSFARFTMFGISIHWDDFLMIVVIVSPPPPISTLHLYPRRAKNLQSVR